LSSTSLNAVGHLLTSRTIREEEASLIEGDPFRDTHLLLDACTTDAKRTNVATGALSLQKRLR
jgi:hypothetical protein